MSKAVDMDRPALEELPGHALLGIEVEGLTVQQAAELTGLSAHTLRYYERAQRHLGIVELKIAYWRAVEAGDDRGAADIARELTGRIQAEARRSPARESASALIERKT